MKILILLFISINIFSECLVESTICVGENETSNDYELINKKCLFDQMQEDSVTILKVQKKYQYFIIKNNHHYFFKTYSFSKRDSFKESYRPYKVKFKRNSFVLKNLETKFKSIIHLKDFSCSVINYIETDSEY